MSDEAKAVFTGAGLTAIVVCLFYWLMNFLPYQ